MLVPRKKVLSFEQTLYRRLDTSFYDQAQEELHELLVNNPEYVGTSYHWLLTLKESSSGGSFARLTIKVYHPTDRDYSALFYLAVVLAIFAVLSGVQAFF